MLPPEDIRKAKSRIAEVIALEEIGRSVQAVAFNLRAALLAAASARFG